MRTESVLRGDIADQAMDENCLACDGQNNIRTNIRASWRSKLF